MQWKLFWVLLASALSSTLAAVPTILHWQSHLTALMMANSVGRVFGSSSGGIALTVAAIAIGSIAMGFADSAVHRAEMFRALLSTRRDRVVFLIRMAIGAYTVWTCACLIRPDLLTAMIVTLASLSIMVYVGAMAEEYLINRPLPERPTTVPDVELVARTEQATRIAYMDDILARAGHPRVKVIGYEAITDANGNEVSRQYKLQTPASDRVGKSLT